MSISTKWNYMRGYYFNYAEKGHRKVVDVPHLRVEFDTGTKLYKGDNVQLVLDEIGEEGWELVTTTPVVGPRSKSSGEVLASLFSIDPNSSGPSVTLGFMLWFKKQIA